MATSIACPVFNLHPLPWSAGPSFVLTVLHWPDTSSNNGPSRHSERLKLAIRHTMITLIYSLNINSIC